MVSPRWQPEDLEKVAVLGKTEGEKLIELPMPRGRGNTTAYRPIEHTRRTDPAAPMSEAAGELARDLRIEIADSEETKSLWAEYVGRYRYLGYTPMAGRRLRYLVYSGDRLLALLGFGASAWKIAPRDWYIGWSDEKREENLQLVVNNARFLILPWVSSKVLASIILARVTKRLPADWMRRYRYQPVLVETFVQRKRFSGTCYRAANWKLIGSTKGRGKNDRFNEAKRPVKDIFLYPLNPQFKQLLC